MFVRGCCQPVRATDVQIGQQLMGVDPATGHLAASDVYFIDHFQQHLFDCIQITALPLDPVSSPSSSSSLSSSSLPASVSLRLTLQHLVYRLASSAPEDLLSTVPSNDGAFRLALETLQAQHVSSFFLFVCVCACAPSLNNCHPVCYRCDLVMWLWFLSATPLYVSRA